MLIKTDILKVYYYYYYLLLLKQNNRQEWKLLYKKQKLLKGSRRVGTRLRQKPCPRTPGIYFCVILQPCGACTDGSLQPQAWALLGWLQVTAGHGCSSFPLQAGAVLYQAPREDGNPFPLPLPSRFRDSSEHLPRCTQAVVKDCNILPAAAPRPQCLGI